MRHNRKQRLGIENTPVAFHLSSFKIDGSDLTGVAFLQAMRTGKFEFEIDEVEIK